jgi:CspA family cold shock protein
VRGKIKFFDMRKGYGFIQPDDGGKDIFVHITQVRPDSYDPLAGDAVSYDETVDRGKPAAHNVLKAA